MKTGTEYKVYFNHSRFGIISGILVLMPGQNELGRVSVAFRNKLKAPLHYKEDKKDFVCSQWAYELSSSAKLLKASFKLIKKYKLNEVCSIEQKDLNKTIKEYYFNYLNELYK